MIKKINFRKISIWLIVIVVLFCVGQATWSIGSIHYLKWRLEQVDQAWADFFKNDTYGGETPQETYAMFIEALSNGDTELASKYFYWKYQEDYRIKFDELKNKGELEQYIDDFPQWAEMKVGEHWNEDVRRYEIKTMSEKSFNIKLPNGQGGYIDQEFPPGEYISFSINFKLNNFSKVWKIDSL
ncbi:MAG: hypothetical protein ABH887_02250 [bacterium]